jgi:septal ring factor EnvC (AmiA/AmiB activator)
MKLPRSTLWLSLALLVVSAAELWGQTGANLNDEEQDKLREAQEPAERIGVYLDLLQVRLERFESYRKKPPDSRYDTGGYLDDVLVDYIALNDELKNWIELQFQHTGDIRRGLRALLERGPQQLAQMRAVQQSPDNYSSQYSDALRDAIDQLSDTIDGATKALAEQEKKFGQMKREEKAEVQASQAREKEEKKRTKEEKKLRKRQRKAKVPGEIDEN